MDKSRKTNNETMLEAVKVKRFECIIEKIKVRSELNIMRQIKEFVERKIIAVSDFLNSTFFKIYH